ncbi:hypothetical protein C1I92_12935 [Jiangella anatolica]|uniref:XRE family transcriptional regulator n=1 Tax=Jiangella anatolica TaxID=2670374 RepID=A0A2W2C5M5_9ACTN|nr:hypothetical protein C1I92_12935 [Jiangella anatolica]
MSRGELAEAVNEYLWRTTGRRYSLDAHTVARYERGAIGWPSAPYREALRAVLGVAKDADLGFHPTPRGRTTPSRAGRFLAGISIDSPAPTRIGWADVEQVRAAVRAVAASENLFGGGLSCESGMAQLRWAARLLDARGSDEVRNAMHEAVGNLGGVVAYSAFDIAAYRAADQCFEFALWCADEGGSWALRANTLAEMSRKAAHLGDLDGALAMIESARSRPDRVSATARAMMSTLRARLLAVMGRPAEALADIERADAHFAERDPAGDPPWLCYYDAAEHEGSTGKALIPLALAGDRPEVAAPRLRTAIEAHRDDYPRSRAFSRIRLATLTMTAGDPREAAAIGRRAVAEAAPLRSRRLLAELGRLADAARPHTRVGDVADLRADIAELAAP